MLYFLTRSYSTIPRSKVHFWTRYFPEHCEVSLSTWPGSSTVDSIFSPTYIAFRALGGKFCIMFSVFRKRLFLLIARKFVFCQSSAHITNSIPFKNSKAGLSKFRRSTWGLKVQGRAGLLGCHLECEEDLSNVQRQGKQRYILHTFRCSVQSH